MHTAPVRRSLGRGLTNQGRNDDPQGPVAERDVERERERERDPLARSLSYLFSWREMLSYLPYRTLSTLLPEADKITGTLKDTMLFWLMQQVEHHRHSRVPRRASMTCTCPATPPPRATANCLIRLRRSFLLPGTSSLLPPTNNRLLHHSTLACPPMTARERTVRKLPDLYLTC